MKPHVIDKHRTVHKYDKIMNDNKWITYENLKGVVCKCILPPESIISRINFSCSDSDTVLGYNSTLK